MMMSDNFDFSYVHSEVYKDKIVIKINSGPFAGISYVLGEVTFPDEDEPILQFHYDIVEGEPDDVQAFEKFVGDALVEMLKKSLEEQMTVFKGGTE
jgi:hypothetical protein